MSCCGRHGVDSMRGSDVGIFTRLEYFKQHWLRRIRIRNYHSIILHEVDNFRLFHCHSGISSKLAGMVGSIVYHYGTLSRGKIGEQGLHKLFFENCSSHFAVIVSSGVWNGFAREKKRSRYPPNFTSGMQDDQTLSSWNWSVCITSFLPIIPVPSHSAYRASHTKFHLGHLPTFCAHLPHLSQEFVCAREGECFSF